MLVYGGRGGLGSVIVSKFKAAGWWVMSVDLAANDEADANGERVLLVGEFNCFEKLRCTVAELLKIYVSLWMKWTIHGK